jgi:hypothetical protein
MHKFSILLFALVGVLVIAKNAGGQTLTAGQPLSFGSFAAGTGGTVSISAAGVRSKSGGVTLVSSGSGAAASFNVGGNANAGYAITLPINGVVFLTSGAHSMAVNNFTSSPASNGLLSGGGAQSLAVGATLSVGSGQASGSYGGNFDVTVEYN